MKTNKKEDLRTFEGAKASKISSLEELKRTTMACLLWEDNFYEDGESVSQRIEKLINECDDDAVIELIRKVKFDMKLRHCPLYMTVCLLKKGCKNLSGLIEDIITRPDDMGEIFSLYGSIKKIPNQLKKGVAKAFTKFSEYQLSKWNRDGKYKLVDIANLTHPMSNEAISKLISGNLPIPNTWEVKISACGNDKEKKKTAWESLIKENELLDMAFLKNLRGIKESGVSDELIKQRIEKIDSKKLLPIDFIRCGDNNIEFESQIENKFLSHFEKPTFTGKTAFLVDVSGSMDGKNLDYASALAMIGREMFDNLDLYTFSNSVVQVPARHGWGLKDAINRSQLHSGTEMWDAIRSLKNKGYERLIVITDEQVSWGQRVDGNNFGKAYIINVATYQRGVGYDNGYIHINGFSDGVFDYMVEIER